MIKKSSAFSVLSLPTYLIVFLLSGIHAAYGGTSWNKLPVELKSKVARNVHHKSRDAGAALSKVNKHAQAIMKDVKTSDFQLKQAEKEGLRPAGQTEIAKKYKDRSKTIDGRAHGIKQALVTKDIKIYNATGSPYSDNDKMKPSQIREEEIAGNTTGRMIRQTRFHSFYGKSLNQNVPGQIDQVHDELKTKVPKQE